LEQNVTGQKFCQDAPERPDVNFVVVAAAKYNFRGAVTSRLNVRTKMVVDETAAAEVDHFDFTPAVGLDEDVFWL